MIALKYRDWLRCTVTSTYPTGRTLPWFGPPRYVCGDFRTVTTELVPSLLKPLAEAMVKHYLTFFPIWMLGDYIAPRDATIWTNQVLTETAQHLLGVLAEDELVTLRQHGDRAQAKLLQLGHAVGVIKNIH